MLTCHAQEAARSRVLARVCPLLFAALLCACSNGPVPRERDERAAAAVSAAPAAPPSSSALPAGHPPLDSPGLPSGHPPVGAGDDVEPPAGEPAPSAVPAPAVPPLAGITWDGPLGFVAHTPSNSMRAAEYASADGLISLAVFHFPEMRETVQANIDRWKAQFDERAQQAARVETRSVAGLSVITLDIEGANAGMLAAAPAAAAPAGSQQRMLAAAVTAPGGFVFFKLVGAPDAVAAQRDSFEALVASLRPATQAAGAGATTATGGTD